MQRLIPRLLRRIRYSLWRNRRRALRRVWLQAQGMQIGPGSLLGKLSVSWPQSVRLGRECVFENNVELHYLGPPTPEICIDIGDNAYISSGVQFNIQERIRVGRDVLIGSGTRLIDHNHGFSSCDLPIRAQPISSEPITIGDDVWIGANVIILKGVQIGSSSIVGAGSVVLRSIPPGQIWAGNPARFLKPRPTSPSQ
jgi:acetyltransferase-like isoleucine patch superfamily enzyme